MSEFTRILSAARPGDPAAAERLLPLVYEELRRLAAQRLAREALGQTLQPTALVHEAYLRLVDVDHPQAWSGRGHFFAAAAEAMRRILVERARARDSLKRGGDRKRLDLDGLDVAAPEKGDDLLALDEALTQLAAADPQAADLVKLRHFAGLTHPPGRGAPRRLPPQGRLPVGLRPRLPAPLPRWPPRGLRDCESLVVRAGDRKASDPSAFRPSPSS